MSEPSGPGGLPSRGIDIMNSLQAIPEIGETEPIIRNWRHYPPQGGWGIEYSINGVMQRAEGQPRTIAMAIYRVHQTAGKDLPMVRIWDYLNMVWGERDPNRVIKPKTRQPAQIPPAPDAHLVVSPSTFGPAAWKMLALFGSKGHFTPASWTAAVGIVTRLLDPSENPNGCEECYGTWTTWRLEHPPEDVKNEHQAAHWVFDLHNTVNRKLGKSILPFEDAVRINQWAFSLESGTAKPI